ncbi:MAG: alpha/beta hydrolase family protein [Planctomycetales bacterium]
MWRRFVSQLIDEIAANVVLHGFLRHHHLPPCRGPGPERLPQLFSGQLSEFFLPPPDPVDWTSQRSLVEERADRAVWDWQFASETSSGWRECDVVWCRHWESRSGNNPLTIVGVDGIVQLGCRWFRRLAERLVPQGIDVVMMDVPGNFRRTPAGYRPGQLILGGDLAHQLSLARQAARDLWRVIVSLQQSGRRVGLVGVSYGGWLASLASLLASDLEFLIALVPPVDFARMLQKSTTIVRALRGGLGHEPIDPVELERLVRPVVPACWQPRLAGSRIILHAAHFDRFVPCHGVESLARTWNTRLVMHEDGHYRLTISPQIIEQVAREVGEIVAQNPSSFGNRIPQW